MPISVSCGQCGKQYSVADSMAGKRAKCQACGGIIAVPAAGNLLDELEPLLPPAQALGRDAPPPPRGAGPVPWAENADQAMAMSQSLPRPGAPLGAPPRTGFPPPGQQRIATAPLVSPLRLQGRRKKMPKVLRSPVALIALGIASASLFVLLVTLISRGAGSALALLLLICCGAMSAGAGIWGLVIAFRDDVSQGLLCIFIPLYNLIYTMRNWDEMKRPFGIQVSCVGGVIVALLTMVWTSSDLSHQQTAMAPTGTNYSPQPAMPGMPPPFPGAPPIGFPTLPGGQAPGASARPTNGKNPVAGSSAAVAADKPGASRANAEKELKLAPLEVQGWNVTVDPASKLPALKNPNLSIELPGGAYVVAAGWPSPFLLIDTAGSHDVRELWDLSQARRTAVIRGEQSGKVLSLSPDGRFYITKAPSGAPEVWSTAAGKPVSTLLTEDFGSTEYFGFSRPTELVIGGRGKGPGWHFEVFNAETHSSLRAWDDGEGCKEKAASLSPGGKYLAIPVERSEEVHVFDTSTGTLAGTVKVPGTPGVIQSIEGTAFSNDGTQLAIAMHVTGAGRPGVRIASIETGTGKASLDHSLAVEQRPFAEVPMLQWLAGDLGWLLGGEEVVDRESGAPVFQPLAGEKASSSHKLRQVFGQYLLYVTKDNSLASLELPASKLAAMAKARRRGGGSADVELPEVRATDLAGARELQAVPVAWNVAADPAPRSASGSGGKQITLPWPIDEVGYVRVARPDVGQVLVTNRLDKDELKPDYKPIPHIEPRHYVLFDAARGTKLAAFDTPAIAQPTDFSPGGTSILTVDAVDRMRADIWSTSGKHAVGWRPFSAAEGDGRQIAWAGYSDPSHVVTVSKTGALVSWQVPECRAAFKGQIAAPGEPAISPGGHLLAVFDGDALLLVDSTTGDARGRVSEPWMKSAKIGAITFSPNGKQLLAAFVAGGQRRWLHIDVATGSTISDFLVPFDVHHLDWCGANHVLTNQGRVVDLALRMEVWRYWATTYGDWIGATGHDGMVWFAEGFFDKPAVLLAASIPHAAMTELVATAFSPDAERVLVPGQRVSIETSILGPPGDNGQFRAEVIEHLANALRAEGFEPAAGQPIKLSVTAVERLTGRTANYSSFGAPFSGGEQTVQLSDLVCTVSLVDANSKAFWQRTETVASGAPMILTLNPNDSLENAIKRGQWAQFSYWIRALPLPSYFARVGNQVAALPGISNMTDTLPLERRPSFAASPGLRSRRRPEEQLGRPLVSGHTGNGTPNCVAISPVNKDFVAIGDSNGLVRIFDSAKKKKLKDVQIGNYGINRLEYSADGNFLLVGNYFNEVGVIDLSKGSKPPKALVRDGFVHCVALSPDGKIVACGDPRRITLYDAVTGDPQRVLTALESDPSAVAFSPNGKWIAYSGERQKLVIVKAEDGSKVHTFEGRYIDPQKLCFSSDSSLLTAVMHNEVITWNTANWSEQGGVRTGSIQHAAVSRDGSRVAGYTYDKVKLWDATTGQKLFEFKPHNGFLSDIDFAPDAKTLATVGSDDLLCVWDATHDPSRTGEESKSLDSDAKPKEKAGAPKDQASAR